MPEYIREVNDADFEYEVIAFSAQMPVVVDFWAEWCAPCRVLDPLLEKLAEEAEGDFRLAKVNADRNPKLVRRFRVHSIPTVKVVHQGQVVAEFSSLKSEGELREFLRMVIPNEHDLALEKAASLLAEGDYPAAEQTYQAVLRAAPDHPPALLGLARSMLYQHRAAEAEFLLRRFPASKEFRAAEALLPLARALQQPGPQAGQDEEPLDAAYHHALRLIGRGNLPAALDGLLDILRQNKRYRQGEPRLVILGVLELLSPDDPLARQYRNELAATLF